MTARNDRVLVATLALLLGSTAATLGQQNSDPVAGMVSSAVEATEADLNSRIPLPEPLTVPPPSARDVSPPTLESKSPAETPTPVTTQSVPSPQQTVQPVDPAPQPTVSSAPEPVKTETVTAPAAFESTSDPVALKLKETVTTRLSRFVDRKEDRPGVESFYAARQYAPIWTHNGAFNARAKAAIAYLGNVSVDGLDPADYPVPTLKAGANAQVLAEAELKLTDSVITFARHAQNGRTHYSRVAGDILYDLVPPDNAKVLANIAENDVAKALDSYTPPHAGYKALKGKLAELRGQTTEAVPAVTASSVPSVRIPEGRILRPGDDSERVALLRQRLQVGDENSTEFDRPLMEAVKRFQDAAGLDSDGSVGRDTVRALNSAAGKAPVAVKQRGRTDTINIVLANMERWRWMPRDLGKAHVMLNVPTYTLKVMNNGNKIWETRVVVGKPNNATPILTETMKFITVNPTWNVPPSIVYGEYLPALQQDPTVLERMGLKVVHNRDGSLHMYQPPGDRNALGRIRFNFPNKFLVYQHDTPDKHLFSRDTRAFSHGCMRVQDPLKYGEVLLSIALPNQNYTAEKLRSMYGPEERDIKFPTPIPVHITYQTAFVDESGKLVFRDDIYGRDSKTLAVLKGEDRRIADVPMDRRGEQQASYQRPPVSLPYGVTTEGNSGNSRYAAQSDGGNFFEMLFGGPRYYQEQPQTRSAPQSQRRRWDTRPLN